MQLDQTRIVIRERSQHDIMDMSLKVMAHFFSPLMLCFATVIVPLMLFNAWLIGWMPAAMDSDGGPTRYIAAMVCLVALQSPLLSLTVTPLLGSALFMEDSQPSKIFSSLRQGWFPLALSHLFFRGLLWSVLLVLMIRTDKSYSGYEVWLVILTFFTLLIRATRPFINEIVLLERNPLRSNDPQVLTVGRRNRLLHSASSSDLIGRWMFCLMMAIVLTLSILGSIWFCWGMLLFDWNWGPVMWHVCFPFTLWVVAAYMSVVRFLSYLDLRIRREGWEVELIMRAAASQSFGAKV